MTIREYIPPTVRPEVASVPPSAPYQPSETPGETPAWVINSANRLITRRVICIGGAIQVITTSLRIKSVLVRAEAANPNPIYVGEPAVTPATGFELLPGAAMTLDIRDLSALGISGLAGNFARVIAEAY